VLTLVLSGEEVFNEETSEFSTVGDFVLHIEHSLLSLSKWESKFEKPFLGTETKSPEELLWYIRFMILNSEVPEDIWDRLTKKNIEEINAYIESKQTATTFGRLPEARRGRQEVITSELIYYWMVAFTIPFECETWHLNRLFSLIRICNIKQQKPTKMSRGEIARRNRDLNAERRAKYNTSG
jgi:hypothetical protein